LNPGPRQFAGAFFAYSVGFVVRRLKMSSALYLLAGVAIPLG
jgi:hypothetical protein